MLDTRAKAEASTDEATADHVLANRVRRDILRIADEARATLPLDANGTPTDAEAAYWIAATRLEARVGLGEVGPDDEDAEIIACAAPSEWMSNTTRSQLTALRKLIS